MASYSIKDLEKLTGVKAHTLRIWEQRYQLLTPKRTETNIRYYSDDQARKLLKVSALYHQGVKISHIAAMDEATMNESIMDNELKANHSHAYIEKLTIAMIELSEELFVTTFDQSVSEHGFKHTITQIIYPFLEKIGIMWQVGDIHPAQEHFMSNLIRQKLIARIDKIHNPNRKTSKRAILFMPEGDLHELGLLFYSYALQEKGYQVIYLGQSVPAEDLFSVAESYSCHLFISAIINPSIVNDFKKTIKQLFLRFPKAKVYLSGSQKELISSSNKSIVLLHSIEELPD